MADVSIRNATPQDGGFIADSWLRSYSSAYHVKKVPAEVYWRRHRDVIADLVSRSVVRVACDPADPWTIWGWVCGEVQGGTIVLHYVYVKDVFRGYDIGTILVRELTGGRSVDNLLWTHDTKQTSWFLKGLVDAGVLHEDTETIYNPYLMYGAL